MHHCCVKYCQNKSTNVRLFWFAKDNCRFIAELQYILRKRRIAWFRDIKFKKTNVSIASIDDCRICKSHFKSGKWLNAALVFYKALHLIITKSLKWKFLEKTAHCLNTTSEDWIPSINVSPDDVENSPMATTIVIKLLFHLISRRKGNSVSWWQPLPYIRFCNKIPH